MVDVFLKKVYVNLTLFARTATAKQRTCICNIINDFINYKTLHLLVLVIVKRWSLPVTNDKKILLV